MRAVVHAPQEYALVEEYGTGAVQSRQGVSCGRSQLAGVVGVYHDGRFQTAGAQGMAQAGGDSGGQDNRQPGVQAEAPQVGDFREPTDQDGEGFVVPHQGVPSAQDDLVDGGVRRESSDGAFGLVGLGGVVCVGEMAAEAVAAV